MRGRNVGSTVRLALQRGVRDAVGLSGSTIEADRLQVLGLNVRYAHVDSIPLPDQYASVVVCNSVLHIVPADNIPASLQEIVRIAETSARIWIGEIPRFREPASLRRFDTLPEMLWWLLQNRGLRSFLGMCRRVVTGDQREPVLRTAQSFWAEPEVFISMAANAGLQVERQFSHRSLDSVFTPCISATRHDYLFRKR